MNNERQAFIQGLRDFASWIEANEAIPLPNGPDFYAYMMTGEDFRQAARVIGTATKQVDDEFFKLKRTFGPIAYRIFTAREKVCTRKVVGTRTLPAEPERVVDIVEWDCGDPLLKLVEEPEVKAGVEVGKETVNEN